MLTHNMKREKTEELKKYRALNLATLDHYIQSPHGKIKTDDFDSNEHYKTLKIEVEDHYQKGRLTKLKQWFRELTEMRRETVDLKFGAYLKQETGYDVDIFEAFEKRINKIVERKKITSENQYRDVLSKVDSLAQLTKLTKGKLTC